MKLSSLLQKKSATPLEPVSDYAQYYASAGVKMSGQLNANYDIFIDGEFEGSIKTLGFLEFGKNSNVQADIKARSCIIEGDYSGRAVVVEDLLIVSCANVKGQLSATNLSVEKGARINAKLVTTTTAEAEEE